MATYAQRAITMIDAGLNATATQSQRDRLTKAVASALPPEATQAQIAERFVKMTLQFWTDQVLAYETNSGIVALRESKLAQIPLDFAETP